MKLRAIPLVLTFMAATEPGCHRIASSAEDRSYLCEELASRGVECGVGPEEDETTSVDDCREIRESVEEAFSAECLGLLDDWYACLVELDCDAFVIGIGPDPERSGAIPCGEERNTWLDCQQEHWEGRSALEPGTVDLRR